MPDNIDAILAEYLNTKAALLFFQVDRDEKIVRINQYAEKLFGKEIVGAPFQSIFVDFTALRDHPYSFREENQDKAIPLSVKMKDALPRTFYFILTDLGEAKVAFGEANSEELDKLQKHFILLNNELNNLTRELQKKNAELAQLNSIKNRFLGMAAHDLRFPMICIKEFSSFLLREHLTDDQMKMIASIQELSSAMNVMVEDLLDISKIEAGVFELDRGRVDLQSFLADTISLNNILDRKKGIHIHSVVDLKIPEIWADQNKLAQVMNNLLSNAIKFSKPSSEIEVRAVNEDNGSVRISIQDSGVGIPRDELDKVFKPFQRLSAKATRGETSTGLGMVIVKNIVEAHRGRIRVESELAKGTTVSFTIPCKGQAQEIAHG
jgi:signal transduction histidine kinase